MEIAGFLLSLLAVFGSIFTYFYHDRKIKEQEKRLNDYQLKKFQLEDIENKKAQIKGNLIRTAEASRTLTIYNTGKSTAYNIRLEVLSELNGIHNFKFEPFEMLNPLEKTEISFYLSSRHSLTLKVKFIWNDTFKEGNEYIQLLTI